MECTLQINSKIQCNKNHRRSIEKNKHHCFTTSTYCNSRTSVLYAHFQTFQTLFTIWSSVNPAFEDCELWTQSRDQAAFLYPLQTKLERSTISSNTECFQMKLTNYMWMGVAVRIISLSRSLKSYRQSGELYRPWENWGRGKTRGG